MNLYDLEQFIGVAIACAGGVALFSPSPLRLLWLLAQRYRGIQLQGTRYQVGLAIHLLNTAISPGIPLYMVILWSKCGGGCANGLPLMFLLPVIWPLFFLGNRLLSKAEQQVDSQSMTQHVDAAVLDALEQYRADQPVTQSCPACLSQLVIRSSLQRDRQEVHISCKCGQATGTYALTLPPRQTLSQ